MPQPWELDQAAPSSSNAGLNPQDATWQQLVGIGLIKPDAQPGTINNPFKVGPVDPGNASGALPAGITIVDRGGKLRLTGENDTGDGQGVPFAAPGGPAVEPWMHDQKDREAPVGAGEDFARSLPPGIAKSAAGVVGIGGDLTNLVDWGAHKLIGVAQDLTGQNLGAPYMGSHDHGPDYFSTPEGQVAAKAAGLPIQPGWAGTGQGLPNGYKGELSQFGRVPTSADANTAIQDITGPYHDPQHPSGRLADALGQFAGAAILPGSVGAKVARVVIPTLSSDAAGEGARIIAPGDANAEGWARALGGLAGGGLQGWGEAIANDPLKKAAMVTGKLNPSQIGDTAALMERAPFNLPWTEAADHTTGGATTATALQDYIENNPFGRPITAPFFANRTKQIVGAGHDVFDQIAPATDSAAALAGQAQDTAVRALSSVRSGINRDATPFYDALKGEELHPDAHASLMENPAYAKAMGDVRGDPILNGEFSGLPDSNLSVVNAVKKRLNTLANGATESINNPGGDNTLAGLYGEAANAADQVGSVSPNWQEANRIVATGRGADLHPLQLGPLGGFSKGERTAIGNVKNALFPSATPEGQAFDTSNALRALELQQAKDVAAGHPLAGVPTVPNLPASLVRQHLADTFNEATQNLASGANQAGGPKWIASVAGQAEQAKTLRGAIEQVAPHAVGAYGDLKEALEAAGGRIATGSRTAGRQEIGKVMTDTGSVTKGARILLSPLELGDHIANLASGGAYRRNIRSIAESIVSGDPTAATAFMAKGQALTPTQGLAKALLLTNAAKTAKTAP